MSITDLFMKSKALVTRKLIGAQELTANSIHTYDHGYIVYFLLEPVNLAVLSRSSIRIKVNNLMNVLKGLESAELVCMGSREDFEENKRTLKSRLEVEYSEPVRRLLEKDLLFLDQIQIQTASAREFLIALRFQKEEDISPSVSRVEKLLKEQGFRARLAGKDDLKRLYAVYFAQNMTQIVLDDYDGDRWAEIEK